MDIVNSRQVLGMSKCNIKMIESNGMKYLKIKFISEYGIGSSNNRLAREEDMDLGEESSAPDLSSTEPPMTDSDGCTTKTSSKKMTQPKHGTIVKKIRDATRPSEDEATKGDKRCIRDTGIKKFKAKKVLTPGSMESSSRKRSLSDNSKSDEEELWYDHT